MGRSGALVGGSGSVCHRKIILPQVSCASGLRASLAGPLRHRRTRTGRLGLFQGVLVRRLVTAARKQDVHRHGPASASTTIWTTLLVRISVIRPGAASSSGVISRRCARPPSSRNTDCVRNSGSGGSSGSVRLGFGSGGGRQRTQTVGLDEPVEGGAELARTAAAGSAAASDHSKERNAGRGTSQPRRPGKALPVRQGEQRGIIERQQFGGSVSGKLKGGTGPAGRGRIGERSPSQKIKPSWTTEYQRDQTPPAAARPGPRFNQSGGHGADRGRRAGERARQRGQQRLRDARVARQQREAQAASRS